MRFVAEVSSLCCLAPEFCTIRVRKIKSKRKQLFTARRKLSNVHPIHSSKSMSGNSISWKVYNKINIEKKSTHRHSNHLETTTNLSEVLLKQQQYTVDRALVGYLSIHFHIFYTFMRFFIGIFCTFFF